MKPLLAIVLADLAAMLGAAAFVGANPGRPSAPPVARAAAACADFAT